MHGWLAALYVSSAVHCSEAVLPSTTLHTAHCSVLSPAHRMRSDLALALLSLSPAWLWLLQHSTNQPARPATQPASVEHRSTIARLGAVLPLRWRPACLRCILADAALLLSIRCAFDRTTRQLRPLHLDSEQHRPCAADDGCDIERVHSQRPPRRRAHRQPHRVCAARSLASASAEAPDIYSRADYTV